MARRYESLVGRPHNRSESLYASALMEGPTPVSEALQLLDGLDSWWAIDSTRALLLAMSDRIDEARVLAHAAERHAHELGRETDWPSGEIEALSGNHGAAADRFGAWCAWLDKRGQTAGVSAYTGWHGRELCLARRYEEAEERAAQARELNQRLNQQDPLTQSLWRQATALVASHRGEHARAEQLAREALTYICETDSPKYQADAFCDLAEVLEAAGRRDDAISAWEEAVDRYERKGILPLARRVRERLADLLPA
jgi:tetratricopeptide (TPR) repeat protein